MSVIPLLSSNDVKDGAGRFYRAKRHHHLIAFFGTGSEGYVRVDEENIDIAVIPIDSELRLRERLLDINADDRAIFLVPWNGTLPHDIAGRFAKSGRIQRVGHQARIQTLFGTTHSDAEVQSSPLTGYLLQYHRNEGFSAPSGHLSLDTMWEMWLNKVWKLPKGELALDALLSFSAMNAQGPVFVSTLHERDAQKVDEALLVHIERHLGQCGVVVWNCWKAGTGRELLHLAVLASALTGNTDNNVVIELTLLARALVAKNTDTSTMLQQLANACGAALRAVKQHAGDKEVREVLREADRIFSNDPKLRSHLIASNRLASAWQGRLDELGSSLSEVAKTASKENAANAIAAFSVLESHDAFSETENILVIQQAQMAVRLAGWLCSHQEIPQADSSYGDVEDLASWFVEEGGYIDWARRTARGVQGGLLGKGVSDILNEVDTLRQRYDRRFAHTLPAWIKAGRPSNQVFPIDESVHRIAAKFLAGHQDRKLLVLLMDGMAWAQTVEILDSLGQQASTWGPLVWHALQKNRIGNAPYPAMLANFPTVTEVSRSAFFAGESMVPGAELSSTKDPKKWETNRDALKYCGPHVKPMLLLKGSGHTKDGAASEEALSLVSDGRRRMVSIVINTIDMSLKNDAAQREQWTVARIKSLRDLLDRARDVGRAVLLVADHGHVPADRFGSSAGRVNGGARWREWTAGEPVEEFEVAMPKGKGVWAPRNTDGVVLLADDSRRYGGNHGSGEHGGAALAEVVSPCVLIGCEESHGIADDAEQSVSPAQMPSWWYFNVGGGLSTPTMPVKKTKRKKSQCAQLNLPKIAASKTPTNVEQVQVTQSAFANCEMLRARTKDKKERQKVINAVEFLLSQNGIAESAAFAHALSIFEISTRGTVTRLQEILNLDGYQAITYDAASKQVRLEISVLSQQFGIEL